MQIENSFDFPRIYTSGAHVKHANWKGFQRHRWPSVFQKYCEVYRLDKVTSLPKYKNNWFEAPGDISYFQSNLCRWFKTHMYKTPVFSRNWTLDAMEFEFKAYWRLEHSRKYILFYRRSSSFGAPPSAELKGFAFMCLFNTLYPSSIWSKYFSTL